MSVDITPAIAHHGVRVVEAPLPIYTLTRAASFDRQDETPVRFSSTTVIEVTDPETQQLHVVSGAELIRAVRMVTSKASPKRMRGLRRRRKSPEGTLSRILHLLLRTAERGTWPNGHKANLHDVVNKISTMTSEQAELFASFEETHPELFMKVRGFLFGYSKPVDGIKVPGL